MSFVFEKKIDPTNEFDTTNVRFEVPNSDIKLTDLLQAFEDFLKASGFGLNGYVGIKNDSED